MVTRSKFSEWLLRVRCNLEDVKKTMMERNNKIISEKIWEVEMDIAYLTFIMDLSVDNFAFWKENLRNRRKVDVDSELSTVQSLLREARSTLAFGLKEAYKEAWLAKGHVLGIQRVLENTTKKQTH